MATSSSSEGPVSATPPAGMGRRAQRLSPRACWQIGIIVLLMAALFREEFRRLVFKWWRNPDWSHGFVIPLMSLYFVYMDRARLLATRFRPNWLGLLVVVAGVALYGVSIWQKVGYTKSVSVVIALAGIVLLLCGGRVLRVVWFPLLFLMFAMPLPERIYVQLTMPLRMLSSSVAARVLTTALPSLDARALGTVIEYLDSSGRVAVLNVEQACAGMRLIMAFGALGVTMAYLSDRPLWHRVVLVASILPIAVACNILRVTTTGLLTIQGYPELAEGTPHAMLGLVMLGVAFGAFGLVSYLLNNILVDVPEEPDAAGGPKADPGGSPKSRISS